MTDPTKVSWTDPTTNVDGSPIAAGEVTGYTVGARLVSGVAGTYPYSVTTPPDATSEPLALLNPALPKGVPLMVAVRTEAGTTSSVWSAEVPLQLEVPAPVPNEPTDVSVS